MADVGVLNLTIKENSEKAVQGLDGLVDALGRVKAAVGNGLNLSTINTGLHDFATKVNGQIVTQRVIKSVTAFGEALSKLSKISSAINFKTEPIADLKKAIGDGITIKGNPGAKIAEIREAMSGDWGTSSASDQMLAIRKRADEYAKNNTAATLTDVAKAIEKFSKAFSNMPTAAPGNPFQQVEQTIETGSGKTKKDAQKVGVNITEGIEQGIQEGKQGPVAVSAELANEILERVKQILGVHSPSTEFKKIGEACAEGFQKGIEKLKIDASVGNNFEKLIASMKEISKVKGGDNITEVAVGIIDLTDAIKRIGKSYSNVTYLANAIGKLKEAVTGFRAPDFSKLESFARTLQENYNASTEMKKMAEAMELMKKASVDFHMPNMKDLDKVAALMKSTSAVESVEQSSVTAEVADIKEKTEGAADGSVALSDGFAKVQESVERLPGPVQQVKDAMTGMLETLDPSKYQPIQEFIDATLGIGNHFKSVEEDWKELGALIKEENPVENVADEFTAQFNIIDNAIDGATDATKGFESGMDETKESAEAVKEEVNKIMEVIGQASGIIDGFAVKLNEKKNGFVFDAKTTGVEKMTEQQEKILEKLNWGIQRSSILTKDAINRDVKANTDTFIVTVNEAGQMMMQVMGVAREVSLEEMEKIKAGMSDVKEKAEEMHSSIIGETHKPGNVNEDFEAAVREMESGTTHSEIQSGLDSLKTEIEEIGNSSVTSSEKLEHLKEKAAILQQEISTGMSVRGRFLDEKQLANYSIQLDNLRDKIANLQSKADASNVQLNVGDFGGTQSKLELLTQKYEIMQNKLAEDIKFGRIDNEGIVNAQLSLLRVAEQIDKVRSETENTTPELEGLDSELKRKKDDADEAGNAFTRFKNRLKSFCDELKKSQKHTSALSGAFKRMFPMLSGLSNQFKRLATRMLLRGVLNQLRDGFKEGIENVYYYSKAMKTGFSDSMDSAASSLLQMKNAIGAAAAPLIQSLIPVLQTVVNWFIEVINYVNQFFALLNGQTSWIRAVPATTTAFGKEEKAAKKAGNAIKDLLADWDELNIIQSEKSGSGSGLTETKAEEAIKMFEQVNSFDSRIKDAVEWIKENFDKILSIVTAIGAGIAMWKISSLFSDQLSSLQRLELAAGVTLLVAGITWGVSSGYSAGHSGKDMAEAIREDALGPIITAGLGGLLIGSVLAGPAGAVVGFTIGAAVSFIAFFAGFKNGEADLQREIENSKWKGDLALTHEQIEQYIQNEFTFDVEAKVKVLSTKVEGMTAAWVKFEASMGVLQRMLSDRVIEVKLGLNETVSRQDIIDAGNNVISDLNSSLDTFESAVYARMEIAPFKDDAGNILKTEDVMKNIKVSDQTIYSYMYDLGQRMAEALTEGVDGIINEDLGIELGQRLVDIVMGAERTFMQEKIAIELQADVSFENMDLETSKEMFAQQVAKFEELHEQYVAANAEIRDKALWRASIAQKEYEDAVRHGEPQDVIDKLEQASKEAWATYESVKDIEAGWDDLVREPMEKLEKLWIEKLKKEMPEHHAYTFPSIRETYETEAANWARLTGEDAENFRYWMLASGKYSGTDTWGGFRDPGEYANRADERDPNSYLLKGYDGLLIDVAKKFGLSALDYYFSESEVMQDLKYLKETVGMTDDEIIRYLGLHGYEKSSVENALGKYDKYRAGEQQNLKAVAESGALPFLMMQYGMIDLKDLILSKFGFGIFGDKIKSDGSPIVPEEIETNPGQEWKETIEDSTETGVKKALEETGVATTNTQTVSSQVHDATNEKVDNTKPISEMGFFEFAGRIAEEAWINPFKRGLKLIGYDPDKLAAETSKGISYLISPTDRNGYQNTKYRGMPQMSASVGDFVEMFTSIFDSEETKEAKATEKAANYIAEDPTLVALKQDIAKLVSRGNKYGDPFDISVWSSALSMGENLQDWLYKNLAVNLGWGSDNDANVVAFKKIFDETETSMWDILPEKLKDRYIDYLFQQLGRDFETDKRLKEELGVPFADLFSMYRKENTWDVFSEEGKKNFIKYYSGLYSGSEVLMGLASGGVGLEELLPIMMMFNDKTWQGSLRPLADLYGYENLENLLISQYGVNLSDYYAPEGAKNDMSYELKGLVVDLLSAGIPPEMLTEGMGEYDTYEKVQEVTKDMVFTQEEMSKIAQTTIDLMLQGGSNLYSGEIEKWLENTGYTELFPELSEYITTQAKLIHVLGVWTPEKILSYTPNWFDGMEGIKEATAGMTFSDEQVRFIAKNFTAMLASSEEFEFNPDVGIDAEWLDQWLKDSGFDEVFPQLADALYELLLTNPWNEDDDWQFNGRTPITTGPLIASATPGMYMGAPVGGWSAYTGEDTDTAKDVQDGTKAANAELEEQGDETNRLLRQLIQTLVNKQFIVTPSSAWGDHNAKSEGFWANVTGSLV